MNVFIRVDASNEIGSGHLMRCLTLAEKLRLQGANVTFISREHVGHLCDLIEAKKFFVLKLPAPNKDWKIPLLTPHSSWLGVPWAIDAKETRSLLQGHSVDLLIIDHYAINYEWECMLKDMVKNIMVIDDLADRKHLCDFLLDPTVLVDPDRYQALVPPQCRQFLGPGYVLLRPEFYDEKDQIELRTGLVRRILIFFGGYDHTNETGKALSSFLALARSDIEVDVVVGQQNIHKYKLREICEQYSNLHFHCQVNNMASLMRLAELAIGAGGTTVWERCFLGLPTIVWSIAENQQYTCEILGKMKVIKYLGALHKVCPASLTKQLNSLIENEHERLEMSQLATQLMGNNRINSQAMIKEIMKIGG